MYLQISDQMNVPSFHIITGDESMNGSYRCAPGHFSLWGGWVAELLQDQIFIQGQNVSESLQILWI